MFWFLSHFCKPPPPLPPPPPPWRNLSCSCWHHQILVLTRYCGLPRIERVPCFLQKELHANGCRSKRIDVWQQAVDTEVFNPRYRSQEMRERMSNGRPEDVILTYVGRLGAGPPPPPSQLPKGGAVASRVSQGRMWPRLWGPGEVVASREQ